ncbi:MAG: type II toxin-antitoxin system VapC family toxin [Actinobacteria bacterium]|nr:type II toxin-antitoxin system VapC family toxin [Actinomycetota bacterium]
MNTRILIDTTAYSSFMKGDPDFKKAIQTADEIFLNSIVIGELLFGFIRGGREEKNRLELQQFLSSPRVFIQTVDEETSERYAVIFNYLKEKGTPIPTNDIWIAASAMKDGLKILTADDHFNKIPQVIAEFR